MTFDYNDPDAERQEALAVKFGGAEPPNGLYFSERALWLDCPQARPVLARLVRIRAAHKTSVSREDYNAMLNALIDAEQAKAKLPWEARVVTALLGFAAGCVLAAIEKLVVG